MTTHALNAKGWLVVAGLALSGCGAGAGGLEDRAEGAAKIGFEIDDLDERGLFGPADGLRARGYEFCIPADPAQEAAVLAIDPALECFRGSRGRIGCSATQSLCIGHTGQKDWRQILERLAAQPTVERIEEFVGE